MIPGITASQLSIEEEGDGTVFPAGDLLAHIDFVDDEYTVDGDTYAITDIFGGPNFDDTTTVLGLRTDSSNNNDAQAIGDLFDAIATWFPGGLTYVFQFERIHATAEPFGPMLYLFDDTDPDNAVNMVLMEVKGVSGAECNDLFDGLVTGAQNILPNARNRVAYTISGDNGDGTWRFAACTNGGTVQVTDVEYPLDYIALARASFFGVNEWGPYTFDGEHYIRGVDIYGAIVNTTTLQALNPTFGADADAGVGQTATFADVVFLCDFDGVDGSTSATDDSASANTINFNGTAQVDTAQSKFGGASLLLDGSGHVTIESTATDSDFHFGTGAFCAEAWVRLSALPSSGQIGVIFGQFSFVPLDEEESWGLSVTSAGALQIRWSIDGTGASTRTVGGGLTTGTWYHIALERDETRRLRLYVDGVTLHSEVVHADFFDSLRDVGLGANSEGESKLTGWIDEPRITKGASQYSIEAGFTPPAAPFPRS